MSLLSAGRRCPSNAPLFQGFFFSLRCYLLSRWLALALLHFALKASFPVAPIGFSKGFIPSQRPVTILQRYLFRREPRSRQTYCHPRRGTNPPAMFDGVSAHRPFDSLGLNVMPGTPVIYHPGDTTDDTKFTTQDLINLVNRGDIR